MIKKYIEMQVSFIAEYDEEKCDIDQVLHDMRMDIKDQTGYADLYDLDIYDWQIKDRA